MKEPEFLEEADVGVLIRPWLDVLDELLELSPTISDPQHVAAGNRNRASDADLRPLQPLPQTPQSRYPAAPDPRPMNPEDNRRLSVNPQVEVERTADVLAHPAPRATRSIRAETAGSSGLALGPNQRGKAGGEIEASTPVMAMAHQRTRRRCRLANPSSSTRVDRATHVAVLVRPIEGREWRFDARRRLGIPERGFWIPIGGSRSGRTREGRFRDEALRVARCGGRRPVPFRAGLGLVRARCGPAGSSSHVRACRVCRLSGRMRPDQCSHRKRRACLHRRHPR